MGRPLNKRNFRAPDSGNEIKVQFHNGARSADGWIEKQVAAKRFKCADGSYERIDRTTTSNEITLTVDGTEYTYNASPSGNQYDIDSNNEIRFDRKIDPNRIRIAEKTITDIRTRHSGDPNYGKTGYIFSARTDRVFVNGTEYAYTRSIVPGTNEFTIARESADNDRLVFNAQIDSSKVNDIVEPAIEVRRSAITGFVNKVVDGLASLSDQTKTYTKSGITALDETTDSVLVDNIEYTYTTGTPVGNEYSLNTGKTQITFDEAKTASDIEVVYGKICVKPVRTDCRLVAKSAQTIQNTTGSGAKTYFAEAGGDEFRFKSSDLEINIDDVLVIPGANAGTTVQLTHKLSALQSTTFNVTGQSRSAGGQTYDRRIWLDSTNTGRITNVNQISVIKSADLDPNEMTMSVRDYSGEHITLTKSGGGSVAARGRPTNDSTSDLSNAIVFIDGEQVPTSATASDSITLSTASAATVTAILPVVRQVSKISGNSLTTIKDTDDEGKVTDSDRLPWGFTAAEGSVQVEEAGSDRAQTGEDDFETEAS